MFNVWCFPVTNHCNLVFLYLPHTSLLPRHRPHQLPLVLRGRLVYLVFLSHLHQSLPIGVRTQGFPFKHRAHFIAWYYRPPCRPISASSLVNRRLTVYLHVRSSDETLPLYVVTTVDILVLQSTFNLHTIRCFLHLIRYLDVAVGDTPQGGNA